ncbi:MAG: hypothetical protein PHG35_04880 [Dehalococcoidales bacterium]|nr:hypothetical protein [Dehalococcoidales bacterium]
MRIDRNTGQTYKNFWDWLCRGRIFWIFFIFFAYGWYLGSTEHVD